MIILLHGINLNKRSMQQIESALKQAGYDVLNIGYSWNNKNLTDIAKTIYDQIKPYCDKDEPLHFVVHSMGSLIVRQLYSDHRINNLGRVVMLGPPHGGSQLAEVLKNTWFYKKVFGPSGQQLAISHRKQHPLPYLPAEIGIIAGDRCRDIMGFMFMSGVHDGRVEVENTKTTDMKDHLVTPTTHLSMLRDNQVIRQIIYFLQNGYFER